MEKIQNWLLKLLSATGGGMGLSDRESRLLQTFAADANTVSGVQQILDTQQMLIEKWRLTNRIDEIQHKVFPIPNGTVGKPYETPVNFIHLGLDDIIFSDMTGLEDIGLSYNNESETISGTPTQPGDHRITLLFRIRGEAEDSTLNEKKMTLVINPDPKSLWKNIPSDSEGMFARPDDVYESAALGDRHIVVASRRGRSHANVGSYRDDDYAFKYFEASQWSVVAVADGAGSATFSRKGAQLATESVLKWFEENAQMGELDEILAHYKNGTGEDTARKLNVFIYNTLSQAALYVHNALAELAISCEKPLKDFHSTLIFALIKKYDFGYAVLSFGVGDCPIALLNPDVSEVVLMNTLDVGEFGGGTRFITMPDIFSSDKFSTRFRFKLVDDFSYLMLMTDGIYDPKFVVEANLEKIENWRDFIADLKGNNTDQHAVDIQAGNPDIARQLAAWMDFWSPGNHDDRTLVIIY